MPEHTPSIFFQRTCPVTQTPFIKTSPKYSHDHLPNLFTGISIINLFPFLTPFDYVINNPVQLPVTVVNPVFPFQLQLGGINDRKYLRSITAFECPQDKLTEP